MARVYQDKIVKERKTEVKQVVKIIGANKCDLKVAQF